MSWSLTNIPAVTSPWIWVTLSKNRIPNSQWEFRSVACCSLLIISHFHGVGSPLSCFPSQYPDWDQRHFGYWGPGKFHGSLLSLPHWLLLSLSSPLWNDPRNSIRMEYNLISGSLVRWYWCKTVSTVIPDLFLFYPWFRFSRPIFLPNSCPLVSHPPFPPSARPLISLCFLPDVSLIFPSHYPAVFNCNLQSSPSG